MTAIVNVKSDSDKDEELYDNPPVEKTETGREITTTKEPESGLERVSEPFEWAYNKETMKQHIGQFQVY